MRTTVYTFILICALLCAPCVVFAGTDDSGLQVYTVDFSKQLGESADVAQEDTLLSPYCYNLFTSGLGICSFPQPKGANYEWSLASTEVAVDCADISSDLLVRIDANGGTSEIYYHVNPGEAYSTSVRTALGGQGKNRYNSDLFSFVYGGTYAVFLGNKIMTVMDSGFSPTTSEVVLTSLNLASTPCKSAAIWQNRLFLTWQNYLYYSAPQDFTNFSNTSSAGGTTRLYDAATILKIVGTKYGLYIFTDVGIFLQSGTGSKNSWVINKISDLLLSDLDCLTTYNDVIYFKSLAKYGLAIWAIDGVQVSIFADIPYNISSGALYHQMKFFNYGKLLVLSTSTVGGTSLVYDVAKKTFFESGEFNGLGDKFFFKKSATGYKIYEYPLREKFNGKWDDFTSAYVPTLYPWAYQTAWMTLDGNSGARKEIDRIEFDCQGGTTAVSLYYAYGNGSSNYATTTLVSPISTRLSTYVWNAPIARQQSNRFYLYFLSSGTQTMTTNFILKQARIYYRTIGNYKTNTLR